MAVTLEGLPRAVAVAVVPGGAVGAHALQADLDAAGDALISVRHVSADLGTNDDLTAEFSITGYNEIDNTGGTDTTDDYLVVTYAKAAGA
ncbi:hypothetical protein [Candidatus Palauibacter sp.]|uniref:hypothetical protein n=1 Tax=Candidatus Palauibacter sp. TaxID=3101350 RepID=UPI003CC6A372